MDKNLVEQIKFSNKVLYEVQKQRIALGNRLFAKGNEGYVMEKSEKLFQDMVKLEKSASDVINEIMMFAPIWDEFFLDVRGVGKIIASSLIAEIGDIERFHTVSSLWAYFGLTASYVVAKCSKGHKLIMASDKHKQCPIYSIDDIDEETNGKKEYIRTPCNGEITIIERIEGKSPKRKKGYHYLFNNRAKKIAWQIGEQMVKQGDDFYRQIYYQEKEKQKNTHPELSKLHIHNRAKRKMVKMFLSHLWEAWRKLENLDIREPYVIEKLGHRGYLNYAEVKQLLKEGREAVRK